MPYKNSLSANPSTNTMRGKSSKDIPNGKDVLKQNAYHSLSISHRDHPLTQEKGRGNVFAKSGKYSILGNGADLHYDPITNPIPNVNKNPFNHQHVVRSGDQHLADLISKRGLGPGEYKSINECFPL